MTSDIAFGQPRLGAAIAGKGIAMPLWNSLKLEVATKSVDEGLYLFDDIHF